MHASKEFVLVHRLVEEIIGAAHDPVNAVVVAVQTGEQYDGDEAGFWFGLHRLTKLESGGAGHHHIQQREINRVAILHPSRLLPICCGDHLVNLCAQQFGEQVAVRFVVIGHQDDSPMAFRSGHMASSTIISTTQEDLRASPLAERWKGGIHPVPRNGEVSHETYSEVSQTSLHIPTPWNQTVNKTSGVPRPLCPQFGWTIFLFVASSDPAGETTCAVT